MMRRWFVVAVFVGACGGGSKPAPAAPQVENKQAETAPPPVSAIERARIAMEKFATDMCACGAGNEACARDVSDQMTKWSQAEAERKEEPPKATEADQKMFTEIGVRIGECMQTAMTAPTP